MLSYMGFTTENAYAALLRVQTDSTAVFQIDCLGVIGSGQTVEVVGLPGVGKSQVLYESCVHCILPKSAGGMQKNAAFIDCDRKFSIYRIVEMVEDKLHQTEMDDQQLETAILECLERLVVYGVEGTAEIIEALHHLEASAQQNPGSVRVCCIDAVDTFYWNDRDTAMRDETSWKSSVSNAHNQIAQCVGRLTKEQKMICVAARMAVPYATKDAEERSVNLMEGRWRSIVDQTVVIQRGTRNDTVNVLRDGGCTVMKYSTAGIVTVGE